MSNPWKWARRAAGFAAVCYAGLHITLPGVDVTALTAGVWNSLSNPLVRLFDSLSGGALSQATILALGITPYLTARVYRWGAEKIWGDGAGDGAGDRHAYQKSPAKLPLKRMTQWLTVMLALIQSFGYAQFLQSIPGAVINPGPAFVAQTMAFLTAVSVIVMWLSERIAASDDNAAVAPDHESKPAVQHGYPHAALNAPNAIDELVRHRVEVAAEEVPVRK